RLLPRVNCNFEPLRHRKARFMEPGLLDSSALGPEAVLEANMILLVDDEPADLEMMRDALTNAGYTVVTADNGKDAIKICQQFDGLLRLLITDVAMSPIDGCELATLLTEMEENLAVLFASGYSGAQALLYKNQAVSPSAFLRKPFRAEELVAR